MRSLRAATALGTVALLAACGAGNSIVSGPAASPSVSPTPAPTPSATPLVSATQACIHRFDYIPAVGSGDAIWESWQRQNQSMESVIAAAAVDHFSAIEVASVDGVRKGFVAFGADPVRNRVIVLVDPALVKASALQGELEAAAQREHRLRPDEAVLPVDVLPSCFGGPALADARAAVEKEIFHNASVHYPATWGVSLDSRQPVQVGTADHAVGERLARKYGPIIEITYSDEHGTPA